MIDRSDLRIVEKYTFLGNTRYRIHIIGTNIVFNVKASTEEEALEKAKNLAAKMGITKEIVEKIREKVKQAEQT
ncbi:MAG: hypothetical protein DRO13_00725 [Thermoprotei archaeon]|nr:MAG: hypothetical protein DRO13_00725 [Thermoprotei archaeon]